MMQISVKSPAGRTIIFEEGSTDTIAIVESKVQDREGQRRLCFPLPLSSSFFPCDSSEVDLRWLSL